MTSLTRAEMIAAGVSFAGIFVAAIGAHLLIGAGLPEATVQIVLKVVIILLFCIFSFALIGLMIHVFIVLQGGIGNANVGMVRFMRENERRVTLGAWIFLGVGTAIAIPAALWDMGVQFKPALKSQGVLVADIGMTLDEVRHQSSLKLAAPFVVKATGESYCVGEAVFDYQLGNSGIRFPRSRYYWMITGKTGNPQLEALNVGITPEKLSRTEFNEYKRHVQQQLKDDGWVPGHFVWHSPEDMQLRSGATSSGDGRYWKRGDTLVILEEKRMDDERPGEDPKTAGQYILYLDLRRLNSEPQLVFDPSIQIDN
jgi:hypothetical protein